MLFLAGAMLFGRTANGYSLEGPRWTPNRTVVMHLSLTRAGVLQDGFLTFNDSAADALNIWNSYLVHMKFNPVIASALPPADGDADTSVFFSNNIYGDPFDARTLAITLVGSTGTTLVEADVIFNNRIAWSSYRGPFQSTYDLHRVALHEFGHVLGLDHPDENGQQVTALMNSTSGDLDSLAPDDIAGAQSIYNNGPPFLSITPAPNLINLSTRAFVGTGDNVLIGGFIIQGPAPATVILRAIGHSLAARGLSDALGDTVMEVRNASGTLVAQNDDWTSDPNAATIASYHLDPANSLESAVLQTLNPGAYTAIVKSFDNDDGNLSGTALVELYDLHTTNGRAGNISTRGQVLTGDRVMIGGFVIGGTAAKEVVIRGIGPSLATSGVANALANPTIELHNASGAVIASNDNWQSDPNAGSVQQAGLAPSEPVEAALDRTLSPGAYTVILRGVNDGSGVGLIEVYDRSPAP